MTTEVDHATEGARQTSPAEPVETLTDLIDRMDREAFHRALEQRDLRLLSSKLRRG
jgi:hypothetical protein